ncbi:MAG: hypothetical protein U9Q89_00665 [Thermodesulfobacteriota bacterium]|nr:hypothetical protein [Thermodesulfobacteriota bacterium]
MSRKQRPSPPDFTVQLVHIEGAAKGSDHNPSHSLAADRLLQGFNCGQGCT